MHVRELAKVAVRWRDLLPSVLELRPVAAGADKLCLVEPSVGVGGVDEEVNHFTEHQHQGGQTGAVGQRADGASEHQQVVDASGVAELQHMCNTTSTSAAACPQYRENTQNTAVIRHLFEKSTTVAS